MLKIHDCSGELLHEAYSRRHLGDLCLDRANLEGAELATAWLKGSTLRGARLRSAVLRRAQLEGVIFDGADLREADLRACLTTASLRDTDLRGAKLCADERPLTGANLKGADLTGSVLGGTSLRGALYDSKTRFPAGFDPEVAGCDRLEWTLRFLNDRECADASRFFCDAYCNDPSYRQLFDFNSVGEARATRPIFDYICRGLTTTMTLGCYDGDDLVGALTFHPDYNVSWLYSKDPTWLIQYPILWMKAQLATTRLSWRYRLKDMSKGARARWKAYSRILVDDAPKVPRLVVNALAVAESHRRLGVARRLIQLLATIEPYVSQCDCITIHSWDADKVALYEKLGFECHATSSRDGVEGFSLRMALPRPNDEAQ